MIVDAHAGYDRAGGKMYGADGRLKEVKAVMPESTFARIYQEMINFASGMAPSIPRLAARCPTSARWPSRLRNTWPHDKTFEIPEDGVATSPTSTPAKC